MKFLIGLLILFLATPAFAATQAYSTNIQKVEIAPLEQEVSMSTVELVGTSWVTCPTVEMVGRKELVILNTSSTEDVYLSSVSPSSVYNVGRYWRLFPRQDITFKIGRGVSQNTGMHIYVSSNSITTTVTLNIIEVK